MQPQSLMKLKVLLPYQVFAEKNDVTNIIAETTAGSMGLLPHRLDCIAALTPGILTYYTTSSDEAFIAVDQGVLVKVGLDVFISVRNAIVGQNLGQLRKAVETDFIELDEREKSVRNVMAKMESRMIRRLVEFHHE